MDRRLPNERAEAHLVVAKVGPMDFLVSFVSLLKCSWESREEFGAKVGMQLAIAFHVAGSIALISNARPKLKRRK